VPVKAWRGWRSEVVKCRGQVRKEKEKETKNRKREKKATAGDEETKERAGAGSAEGTSGGEVGRSGARDGGLL
jgi:hypothetical protein